MKILILRTISLFQVSQWMSSCPYSCSVWNEVSCSYQLYWIERSAM